jgi:hypothetical protein
VGSGGAKGDVYLRAHVLEYLLILKQAPVCFDCEKLQTRPEHGSWNYVNTEDFRAHPQDSTLEPESIPHKDDSA